ncbi:MAG: CBS domain-containing protein [Rhodospirillales bacterium]
MLVRHFMVRSVAATSTVLDTAPLSAALARMIKHHLQQLIVIDANDKYVGEITSFTLAKLLLPEGDQSAQEAEWETVGDVDQRIQPQLGRRVADFVDTNCPVMRPDTPLGEALVLLAEGTLRMPVVDPATEKLCGVISALTILRRYQF